MIRDPDSASGRGGIRTPEGIRQQIYSLPPLATWVLARRDEDGMQQGTACQGTPHPHYTQRVAEPVRQPADVRRLLDASRDAIDTLIHNDAQVRLIEAAGEMLCACFRTGGRVLACGNGGSACDAMHFAEELTGRFRDDREPLPAMALLDPAHITCVANDFGFEEVFSRMVRAHGRKGDVLIALSTSGNSPNIVRAVDAARAQQMRVIALLGRDGGQVRGLADIEIIIPQQASERIQEVHMLILHILVDLVERDMFGG